MTISLLQIKPGRDGHELKVRFTPQEKAERKGPSSVIEPAVREAVTVLLEEALEGLKAGRGVSGGHRGFWQETRVEEIVVDRRP